jgi:ribosomal protein S18 acetylase RimI-like enzyme
MPPTWRPMTEADLPAVQAMADRLHPHHPESPAVFAERLALAPAGCLVLAAGARLLGYAVTHPWTGTAPPPLDALLGALPEQPGAWHVHDIALDPAARGGGHALAVLRALLTASPLPRATLVAIPGTGNYWTRQGFRDTPPDDAAALASYGAGARFMERPG